MKIYHYHPYSGELLGEGQADPDPMADGGWLIPAHATATVPSTIPLGHVAVFTEGQVWTMLPDARGVWFNDQHKAVRIDDIEADVTGLTRTPPDSEDHDLVNGVWVLNPARASITLEKKLVAAVQAHMDSAAQARGYDNLLSAVSYADEPAIPSFQTEGQSFRAWRSLVWAKCHELLVKVQASEMAPPTEAELIAQLPEVVL